MTAAPADRDDADVLVVGGGPAGLAAAIELARRDRHVVVVDRGTPLDGPAVLIVPRGVAAVRRLGLDLTERFHVVDRLRISAFGTSDTVSIGWPPTRGLKDPALVAPRDELVDILRSLAEELGVSVMAGCDAVAPIVERGFVRGSYVRDHVSRISELRATFTVVADGPNSPFGRLLGTFRQPDWPYAVVQAAAYSSPLDRAPEAEIVVGVTDRIDTPIVGYGWMVPTGGESVSVGVVLTSTSPSFEVTNPSHLLDRFADTQRSRWRLGDEAIDASVGGRLPMGVSVGPLAGPTYVIVGDAAGAANPLTGTGIETALETGILAGDVVGEALAEGGAAALQNYPKLIDKRYGSYYKTARLATRILGQPAAARRTFAAMTSRRSVADGVIRIATRHLRSGTRGAGPEFAFRLARALSTLAPDA